MAAEKEEAEKQMQAQRDEFEEKMANIKAEQADLVDGEAEPAPMNLTPSERKAVKKAIKMWRAYRYTSLRSELFSATPLIKEANAICLELKKNVSHCCFRAA